MCIHIAGERRQYKSTQSSKLNRKHCTLMLCPCLVSSEKMQQNSISKIALIYHHIECNRIQAVPQGKMANCKIYRSTLETYSSLPVTESTIKGERGNVCVSSASPIVKNTFMPLNSKPDGKRNTQCQCIFFLSIQQRLSLWHIVRMFSNTANSIRIFVVVVLASQRSTLI